MSVFWTLVLILLGIVLILAVPLELRFDVQREKNTEAKLRFRWLFGLVRFTTPVKGGKDEPAAPAGRNRKARRTKAGRGGMRTLFKLAGDTRSRRHLFRFVRDLLQALHLSNLSLRLRLGLDDPAETGRLWAFMGPLAVYLRSLRRARVSMEPVFSGEALQLNSHGQAKIVPIQVLYLVLAFLLSPAMLRSLWLMRDAERQRS